MIEEKWICPTCGFESNGPGLCPTCDENLKRVCDCGSGKYATECCAIAQPAENEAQIAAEVKAEDLEERLAAAETEEEEDLKETSEEE